MADPPAKRPESAGPNGRPAGRLSAPLSQGVRDFATFQQTQRALLGNPSLAQTLGTFQQTQRALQANTSVLQTLGELQQTQRGVQPASVRQAYESIERTRRALRENANRRLVQSLETSSKAALAPVRTPPRPGLPEPKWPSPTERPWRDAAIAVRRHAILLLTKRDQSLIDRLDGAWERVTRGGPHSASQAAHSMIELADWYFRSAAPDDGVIEWHANERRPQGELSNGNPTRPLRMRYILRERDPDGPVASTYVRHAQEALNNLQKIKHAGECGDNRELVALIMSVENVLIFLTSPG